MKEMVQRDLQEELDQESYKCFHPRLYAGLFMNFSNIFFIRTGAFSSFSVRCRRKIFNPLAVRGMSLGLNLGRGNRNFAKNVIYFWSFISEEVAGAMQRIRTFGTILEKKA